MDTKTIRPETIEERIVWHTIRLTYLFFILGALYVVAPVVAWVLLIIASWRFVKQQSTHPQLPKRFLPSAIWAWIVGMFCMLIILWVGHLDFSLGHTTTLKSSIGWAKGWALLAIFPLAGCCRIRPEIIYRAAMHVCLHTLVLLPLFIGAWIFGLPETLYVSPLQIIGGPGPEFFSVTLYEIDPGSNLPRWRLFAPWAPALGFVANLYFLFALKESSIRWKCVGIIASLMMVALSGSRLAIVALLFAYPLSILLEKARNPVFPFVLAITSSLLGIFSVSIYKASNYMIGAFRSARADSTRVRAALERIALDRSFSESPIWGHGVVERGPHLVEYMPIGSHHTWLGLLFVKGVAGVLALAIPLLFTLSTLLFCAHAPPTRQLSFAAVILISFYSLGENLEMLAYLFWPGLLMIGVGLRDIAINENINLPISTQGLHP